MHALTENFGSYQNSLHIFVRLTIGPSWRCGMPDLSLEHPKGDNHEPRHPSFKGLLRKGKTYRWAGGLSFLFSSLGGSP